MDEKQYQTVKIYVSGGVLTVEDMPENIQIIVDDEDVHTTTTYKKEDDTIIMDEKEMED